MLSKSVLSLTLFTRFVAAFLDFPEYLSSETYISTLDFESSAGAYRLIDTYDASNWLSQFNVQAVSNLPQRIYYQNQLIRIRFLIPRVRTVTVPSILTY